MHEVLTPAEMKIVDQLTVAAGTPISALMEEAGYAVANTVAARHDFGVRISVLAGPGDNGGDAAVAARVLAERGYAVSLTAIGAPLSGGAAASAFAAYRGETALPNAARLDRADVIVDGLFGGGLTRPLEGDAADLVAAANAARNAGATVYAIDLPSGVDGATGASLGSAIMADHTITFCRRRVGHLLMPGRAHAGRVHVADIGIKDGTVEGVASPTFENTPRLWRKAIPRRAMAAHKYSGGHAVVLSGPVAGTGASRLAAHAALRAGAGLVTLATSPAAVLVNAAHLTTVMLAPVDGPAGLDALLSDARHNAVCIGPGLPADAAARAMADTVLRAKARAVLDAGAITAFADRVDELSARIGASAVIMTPHEGEFARLFPGLEGDKLNRARSAADRSGAVVVLKGADTVIAAPGGRAAINANAPAALATAGTGDVLSGIITGLLAQNVPTFEAAAMGVWLHGLSGQHAGPALIADDLVDAIRPARTELLAL